MTSSAPSPFATTRWTLIAAAGQSATPESRRALGELCASYWYPLYAYARRKGLQPAEAQDITQSFFAELLEKDRLQMADRQRGRFRSFLLASLNHFLANYWRQAQAQKRGGGLKAFSLDFADGENRYVLEPVDELTPERIFERRWAVTLLEHTLARLRAEYVAADKEQLFDKLKMHLGGDDLRTPYEQLAPEFNTTASALKVAAHRLRRRYRELLRDEIAETVSSPEEVDEELRALFQAVAGD
jgi:DNA-directed RNA polymerase specialized sigma24 family protein